jgi:hypothetical protein
MPMGHIQIKTSWDLNRATPNLITQRIQEALEAACPLTPIKPSFRIGWWTEELQKLKKLTRVSLQEANAQGDNLYNENYKELLQIY